MDSIAWVELDGVVNMRDLGGTPTADGAAVRPGRLLRSDNLQDLSTDDLQRLAEIGVTDVIDLRTSVEVENEGAGPLRSVDTVVHHHHTLFREDERVVTTDEVLALPWDRDEGATDGTAEAPDRGIDSSWTSHYLGYLADRPDSVIAALRAVARAKGAAIVHCAAGKDRTGTVVGLALAVVGVSQERIVADYAATGQRLERIVGRLKQSPTYRTNLEKRSIDEQRPHPEVMDRLLSTLDQSYGGVLPWLEQNGWTAADTTALRAKLLEP